MNRNTTNDESLLVSSENAIPTLSELLTIVIPTRNRADFLELCLRSIFNHQTNIPKVIVSDNSSSEAPGMEMMRSKYDFFYVRQSGGLSMTEHHNACLKLVSTPWALLLHDDDELCPNILEKLEVFLGSCNGSGIVVGGIEYIDQQGISHGVWVPETNGILKGEEGVLRLGLDFNTSPPGWVWNVQAFHQAGGFPDAEGVSADYPLILQLTYSHGAALFSEIVGRYRIGPQQTANYSTPARAEAVLDCSIRMAQLTRTIGVSARVADQLMDYMTWWIFRIIAAGMLEAHPFFVSRLFRKCTLVTPPDGAWKNRVRGEYPFLFWRPHWISMLLFSARTRVPRPIRKRVLDYIRSFRGSAAPRFVLRQAVKRILPNPLTRIARRGLIFIDRIKSRVRLATGVQPLSYEWGFDRGVPIHRYYLEQFLQEFACDIRGHCLEFQNPSYTPHFGGSAVQKLDILHIDHTNPRATIVADLTKPNDIPSNAFDCITCTHVLHVIAELDKAVSELHRILKPRGVLLISVPHISMCDPGFHELWRFTPEGLGVVLAKVFGPANVIVRAYGNSLTAAGEIRGLVAGEFSAAALEYHDPRFAVEVCARAYKAD